MALSKITVTKIIKNIGGSLSVSIQILDDTLGFHRFACSIKADDYEALPPGAAGETALKALIKTDITAQHTRWADSKAGAQPESLDITTELGSSDIVV